MKLKKRTNKSCKKNSESLTSTIVGLDDIISIKSKSNNHQLN